MCFNPAWHVIEGHGGLKFMFLMKTPPAERRTHLYQQHFQWEGFIWRLLWQRFSAGLVRTLVDWNQMLNVTSFTSKPIKLIGRVSMCATAKVLLTFPQPNVTSHSRNTIDRRCSLSFATYWMTQHKNDKQIEKSDVTKSPNTLFSIVMTEVSPFARRLISWFCAVRWHVGKQPTSCG